jgi:hypothetical protein
VTAAKKCLTQASSSESASVTSVAIPDERALFIQATGGYNWGRMFGLSSEAVQARQ